MTSWNKGRNALTLYCCYCGDLITKPASNFADSLETGRVFCKKACKDEYQKGWDHNRMRGAVRSESWCQNISSAKKGKKVGPFTDLHKQRIADALRGKVRPREWCENIASAKKGKCSLSAEQIESFKQRFKGEGNPFYGKTHSFQTRQKIVIRNYQRIYTNKPTGIEVKMENALKQAGVYFESQKRIYGRPDFFLKPNICIFCDGDYYHANPSRYKAGMMLKKGCTAADIWKRDTAITVKLELMGYKVLRFWETEINQNIEHCISKIIAHVKTPLEYSTAKEISQ